MKSRQILRQNEVSMVEQNRSECSCNGASTQERWATTVTTGVNQKADPSIVTTRINKINIAVQRIT